VAEGARLESVFRGNSNLGSNPSLSAIFHGKQLKLNKIVDTALAVRINIPQGYLGLNALTAEVDARIQHVLE
jgi:hypothetical protein